MTLDYLVRFKSVSEAVRYQGQVNRYYKAAEDGACSFKLRLEGGRTVIVPANTLVVWGQRTTRAVAVALGLSSPGQLLNLPFGEVYAALGDSPDVTVTTSSSAPGLKSDGGVGTGLKFDGDKPRMNLVVTGMPHALLEIGKVLTFGASKYEANSWKGVPNGEERYLAASIRHNLQRQCGEVLDKESGLMHLAHEACNILFQLELELTKKSEKL